MSHCHLEGWKRGEWKNGRMEEKRGKGGRMEEGRVEGWKDGEGKGGRGKNGRVEEGRMEEWKNGRMEKGYYKNKEKLLMHKKKKKLLGVLAILLIAGASYILFTRYAEHIAEKEREAKIIAENEAKYNHWKTINDISQKAAALNRKIIEIGDISDENKIRNFEKSDQLLELLRQKRKIHEEFDRIKDEGETNEQLMAWMGVDAARDAYLESQVNLNKLTSIKSEIENGEMKEEK